jgi:BirA family biotin operon repressor/biotin-[acetyl-CoA-carboxylase] ligase
LREDAAGLELEVIKTVPSTNQLLREMAQAGAGHGKTIVAAAQTAGRGRLGRRFHSPPDTGVYLSVLLRPPLTTEQALSISVTAAVAVCEAIETVSDQKAQIKWVNDVLVGGKKVCGILTESSFRMESRKMEYAVLGVGINVYTPEGGFPDDIAAVAGSVLRSRRVDARNRITAEFLNGFMRRCGDPDQPDTLGEYRRRSCVVGRRITVRAGNQEMPATALGIDETCRLIGRYDAGAVSSLSSGEISIKL